MLKKLFKSRFQPKKTNKIEPKNRCILLISGFIRDNCDKYIIDGIQQVIFIFYYNPINSKILNDNEKSILLDMVTKHRNIQSEYKLIYRSTRDGFTRKAFYNRLQKQKPSLHIIETSDGDVFGAFVSVVIPDDSSGYKTFPDDKAFLYTLRTSDVTFMDRKIPRIFPIKSDMIPKAIGVQSYYWLMFGSGADEFFTSENHFKSRDMIYGGGGTFHGIPSNKYYLTSGNKTIMISDIETFILIDK